MQKHRSHEDGKDGLKFHEKCGKRRVQHLHSGPSHDHRRAGHQPKKEHLPPGLGPPNREAATVARKQGEEKRPDSGTGCQDGAEGVRVEALERVLGGDQSSGKHHRCRQRVAQPLQGVRFSVHIHLYWSGLGPSRPCDEPATLREMHESVQQELSLDRRPSESRQVFKIARFMLIPVCQIFTGITLPNASVDHFGWLLTLTACHH